MTRKEGYKYSNEKEMGVSCERGDIVEGRDFGKREGTY